MKKLQASIPILAIYCLWIAISCALYLIGLKLPELGSLRGLLFPLVILLFIILGFFLTSYFLIYGWRRLTAQPGVYTAWLIFSLFLSLLLYSAGQGLAIWRPGIFIVNTANLFVFANLVGTLIVSPLNRTAELIILCVVVALADLFSVLSGPTRAIVKSVKTYYEGGMKGPAPPGDFLLIKFPIPGAVDLQPVFGVSDWIIIVFLSTAAFKFGINDNLAGKGLKAMKAADRLSFYFPVAGLGLVLAMAAANIFGVFLPVLPLIALVYIVYMLVFYPSSRRLGKTDWWLMFGFAAVMLCLFGLGVMVAG